MNSKLKTYLGFSIKSNQIVFGFDNLLETRKKVKLVLYDNTVNPKIEEKLKLLCDYKKWSLVKLENEKLGELVSRDNCKVVGLIDKNLADAVLKESVNIIIREEI